MKADAFLDTSFVVALAAPADQLHPRAVGLADEVEAARVRLVTTRAVLLEVGNSLAKRRHRADAVRLLASLEADPTVEVVEVTAGLYDEAFDLYRSRPDKDWGLVDCVSFVVMRERSLTDALTFDEHFVQAGFVALMR